MANQLNFRVGDVVKFYQSQLGEVNSQADRDGVSEDVLFDDRTRATVIDAGRRLNDEQWMNYKVRLSSGDVMYVRSKWISRCNECSSGPGTPATYQYNRDVVAEEEESMGFVGNAVNKVRQLAMGADDRLLRKYAITDDCGNVTNDGKELLLELLFTDNKEAVVAKLKEIDAEAAKEAKKNK